MVFEQYNLVFAFFGIFSCFLFPTTLIRPSSKMGFSPISFEVDGIGFEHESSCIHLKTIPTERKKIILL